MVVVLETRRLLFEPFTIDDLPLLIKLHGDAEVQRYLGGHWTSEAVERNLRQQIYDQQEVGFSKWKVTLRGGEFIGKAGIQPFPREGAMRGAENEMGCALLPSGWGKGIATETAGAIMDWYFEMTNFDVLAAFAEPQNIASQAVLRKLGFSFVGVHDIGTYVPHNVFRIERWQAQHHS